MTTIRHLRF